MVICHPVIDVEAVRRAKIVSTVDTRGKHDVSHYPSALERYVRCEDWMPRTIANRARMRLREHHHSGRVTQFTSLFGRFCGFANTMINNQPTVPSQDGGSAAPNFQPFPGFHRSGQPVMGAKVAQVMRLAVVHFR